jgi:hypothetical protein
MYTQTRTRDMDQWGAHATPRAVLGALAEHLRDQRYSRLHRKSKVSVQVSDPRATRERQPVARLLARLRQHSQKPQKPPEISTIPDISTQKALKFPQNCTRNFFLGLRSGFVSLRVLCTLPVSTHPLLRSLRFLLFQPSKNRPDPANLLTPITYKLARNRPKPATRWPQPAKHRPHLANARPASAITCQRRTTPAISKCVRRCVSKCATPGRPPRHRPRSPLAIAPAPNLRLAT